jgi:aspartate dehydrogenase
MQQRLALIGCGAIARAAMELLRGDPLVRVTQVIVHETSLAKAREYCATLGNGVRVATRLDLTDAACPHLVAECAGHQAVVEHVLPALAHGVPAVVASIGALHDAEIQATLADAAEAGGARVHFISGAIGGIDALAAARLGGLESVDYIGRKPVIGWRGTLAEELRDLDHLQEEQVIFHGTAREAARLYPKNANVAATVSLAGLGLDATRATLIADPSALRNVHRVVAQGAFGRLDITLENEPLAANPKTSALTVYSIVRAIHNASGPLAI